MGFANDNESPCSLELISAYLAVVFLSQQINISYPETNSEQGERKDAAAEPKCARPAEYSTGRGWAALRKWIGFVL
jgi:hypothetical protein